MRGTPPKIDSIALGLEYICYENMPFLFRPAFMDEYEKLEEELQGLYEVRGISNFNPLHF